MSGELVRRDQTPNDTVARSSPSHVATDTWSVTVATSEERSVRVDQIRREIAEGSYRVPGEAVADAILRFFAREP